MERHDHLQHAPEVRASLLAMSAATIDRALNEAQESGGSRKPSRATLGRDPAQRSGSNL
jgi:hypothetical protein